MLDLLKDSTLENWINILNYAYFILVAGSLVLSVGLVFFNNAISKRKDESFRQYKVTTDSIIAQTNLETKRAQLETADVKKATQELRLKADSLEENNIALRLELEKEKGNRLKIEENLSPRFLEQWQPAKRLSIFKDATAIIQVVPDYEANNFAGYITFLLQLAGWKVVGKPSPPVFPIDDGVTICHSVGAIKMQDPNDFCEEMSDSLLSIFEEQKIEAKISIEDLPSNTILIQVGYKPNKFSKLYIELEKSKKESMELQKKALKKIEQESIEQEKIQKRRKLN